ncbi:MAG: protein kinase [Chloroflexi bacterium]|nr:protein kinase [Chloroflexota bacterium]MCI0646764.1 protein kinase [Chloroflexota bacterium]MCI0730208.1 protein kinase [Chloroflexota bacterium]
MIGQTINGRYQVEALVGRGGMSTVYRATDLAEKRPVAIKSLHFNLVSGVTPTRFYREFRVLTRLDHSHIVRAYDYGAYQDIPYLVLEWLPGWTLNDVLAAGPLSRERLLHIGRQICHALLYLHSQSIVHRDLKPGNIMVLPPEESPQIKLMDFGLVRLTNLSVQLTQEGSTVGTLAYIAPEQAQGLAVDFRADLYALGIVLYEMATGRPPFVHENAATVLLQQMTAQPLPPRHFRPELDEPLSELILHLLAKEPARRPASTEVVARQLAQLADESAPTLDPLPRRVDLIPRIPLIGRTEALERLATVWARVQTGQGQIALAAGVAGAGKSRLLGEVGLQAQIGTERFLRGHCREQASLPYQPLTDALDGLVLEMPSRQRDELPAELARLLPSISESSRDEPAANAGDARQRLFAACWNVLRQSAGQRALFLAIEDLQWADPTTLELLGYLASRVEQSRILLALTYRPEEAETNKPLLNLLHDLDRNPVVEKVAVPLLVRDQVRDFLRVALNWERVPEWLVDSFHTATDGNPLFIEETLKALAAEGQVTNWRDHDRSQWTTLSLPGTALQLPKSVLALAERRLQALSADDRAILTAAAVIGPEFSFGLLQEVAQLDENRLIDAIERLLATRFIEELPLVGSEDRYRFSQESLRQALLNTISHRRLRLLHQRTGEFMQSLYDTSQPRFWPALAYHFAEAGDASRALKYFTLAGDAAGQVYAHAEAVAHYSRALEMARVEEARGLPPSREQLNHLYGRRGRCLELCTEFEQALDNYRTMQQVAQARDDQALEMEALLAQAVILSTNTSVSQPQEGQKAAEQALAISRALNDRPAESKALWTLLLAYRIQGDPQQALTYGEQSLAIAREDNLREQLAYTLNDLYVPYIVLEDAEKARLALEEARELLREQGNMPILADNLGNLAGHYLDSGNFEKAMAYGQEILEISEASDNLWGRAYGMWALGFTNLEYGHLAEALGYLQECVRLSESGGLSWTVAIRATLGWYLADLGDVAAGVEMVQKALQMAEHKRPEMRPYALAIRARLHVKQGEVAAARSLLADVEAPPNTGTAFTIAQVERDIALQEGQYEWILADLEEPIRQVQERGVQPDLSNLLRWRGQTLLAMGRLAEAEACLVEARNVAVHFGARYRLWQVFWPLYQARLKLGKQEQAAQLVEEAGEVFAYLLDHLPEPALRAAFTALPGVRPFLPDAA